MVLCIGQNGHIAIEASDSRCCGRLPWVTSRTSVLNFAQTGPSATDDDCGSCLDIPISSGAIEAVGVPNGAAQLDVPVSMELEPLLVARPCLCEFQPDLKFLILPSYFTPLDTTILLI